MTAATDGSPQRAPCAQCCHTLARSICVLVLVLLNLSDLASGSLLVAWSIWLHIFSGAELPTPALWTLPLSCGVALLISAVPALVALRRSSLRCLRCLAMLALPICVVGLASGGTMIGEQEALFHALHAVLRAEGEAHVKLIEKYFVLAAYGILGVSALQLLRFAVTRALTALAHGEEAEKTWVDEATARELKAKEREERLRVKYADKRRELRERFGDVQSDGARDALMDFELPQSEIEMIV